MWPWSRSSSAGPPAHQRTRRRGCGCFPAGDAREAGIREIVSRWSDADFPAVLAWVESLDDEALHREAVHALAVTLGELPDEAAREKLLQAITTGGHPEIENALKKIALEHRGRRPGTGRVNLMAQFVRLSSRATIIKVSRTPGAKPPSVCTASITSPSRMNSNGTEPE